MEEADRAAPCAFEQLGDLIAGPEITGLNGGACALP
jgi:hypothetical protein